THQIRVHMAFVGCPVAGDSISGFRKSSIKIGRMFLHAKSITFRHPITDEEMTIETELPPELQQALDKLPR
ncbi:MAG: RNA pseudouridine synthase, partial [Anaerolineae bacterium]|nr:RNA pseudouridine synthase [Anaerolineae bacterium]